MSFKWCFINVLSHECTVQCFNLWIYEWKPTILIRVYTYSIVLLKETSKGLWRYVSQHLPCISKIHTGKLTWKWKTNHLKMYLILKLKLVMFHCHVRIRSVFGTVGIWSQISMHFSLVFEHMFVLQDLQAKGRVLRKALENSTNHGNCVACHQKLGNSPEFTWNWFMSAGNQWIFRAPDYETHPECMHVHKVFVTVYMIETLQT